MLFNEPKLLKSKNVAQEHLASECFSALQRAEIAEIRRSSTVRVDLACFSALQRAEIAEIVSEQGSSSSA